RARFSSAIPCQPIHSTTHIFISVDWRPHRAVAVPLAIASSYATIAEEEAPVLPCGGMHSLHAIAVVLQAVVYAILARRIYLSELDGRFIHQRPGPGFAGGRNRSRAEGCGSDCTQDQNCCEVTSSEHDLPYPRNLVDVFKRQDMYFTVVGALVQSFNESDEERRRLMAFVPPQAATAAPRRRGYGFVWAARRARSRRRHARTERAVRRRSQNPSRNAEAGCGRRTWCGTAQPLRYRSRRAQAQRCASDSRPGSGARTRSRPRWRRAAGGPEPRMRSCRQAPARSQ